MDKVRGMRDGLSDRILQQHKDTANDHFNRGKQFLTEESFLEENLSTEARRYYSSFSRLRRC